MVLKDYIQKLQKFAEDNPEALEMEVTSQAGCYGINGDIEILKRYNRSIVVIE